MIILGGLNELVVFLFFNFLNSYFIAKHFYIFRNKYFDDEFNENVVMFWIRFLNFLSSFVMLLFEFALAENIYQLSMLQVLNQGFYDENLNLGIVHNCLSTLVFFTIIGNYQEIKIFDKLSFTILMFF